MSSKKTPLPEEPPTLSDQDVAQLWDHFKSGRTAKCPRDSASLALSVDGASKAYRLVCTRCGIASKWFAASPTGLTLRGQHVELRSPEEK